MERLRPAPDPGALRAHVDLLVAPATAVTAS
jgi:hypothetical protein